MTSDTDSITSSSSSSESERKRKQLKKLKKMKKHKKEKKSHKEKKRLRKDKVTLLRKEDVKPIAPPRILDPNAAGQEEESFGPALPPHLLVKHSVQETRVIGPTMPKDISLNQNQQETAASLSCSSGVDKPDDEEDNLQGSYGPIPTADKQEMSTTQIELEKRALELKLAAIDGVNCSTNVDSTVREEWMLELPEVGLKGGLAALNNLKRGFHQGKERPDFSDRSSWTKTPQNEETKQARPNTSKESLKAIAKAEFDKQRDAEQEALAKKHKKKNKREESLVDMHQKKLRKEEKRKAKELKESGAKPERRPFSRDIDLKLNKIDSNQTKQIVDKAKILDSKFSRGHTKYL
uniref:DUF3752 domain-containing protein n=1 Tax=Stomoxys calcitrans TaxID=35570 RepID=A0A1I8P5G3_STOCA